MVQRKFWIARIEQQWRHRSILWLAGVRRVGKTYLCQSLPDIEYFDCELPSVRKQLADPEAFLSRNKGGRLVLDEVHRLRDPAQLLKIAADHYPSIQVLATGSSTLQASAKFRDSLTGRKTEIRLTPMLAADLDDFGNADLSHRFLHGGLPPFFLSDDLLESDFQEWLDSYWAKDIQELFRLERHFSFHRFAELIFARSGGIFEATRFAAPCEISRTTVANYLTVLEKTFVAHIVRPFSSNRQTEIVSAPKVYAFDTGFVCHGRGWSALHTEDLGYLWEHYVLNEIYGERQGVQMRYWRDKRGRELDFIWAQPGKPVVAIECKWSTNNIDGKPFSVFRKSYAEGPNLVVLPYIDKPYTIREQGVDLEIIGLRDLIKRLS